VGDVTRITGWQLDFAIRRAVAGDQGAIAEVLRSGYQPSAAELKMLADYHAGRIKRPAHRPKSNDPHKLIKSNPVLWRAVDFVEQYKRDQRALGRVKGVEPEAVDKALAFIATKFGAPAMPTAKQIEEALDRGEKEFGYRLTADKLVNRLHRPQPLPRRPKKRT